MNAPALDVLIVTWNRKSDLVRSIESIRSQSFQPARVIVVDNGSEDGTRDLIPRDFPEVVFLPQRENLGACGGRNAGMGSVTSELVFFMDDDTELLPECLEEIANRFASNSELGAVQPIIFLSDQDAGIETAPTSSPNPHPISAAWCVRTDALPPSPWPDHFVRQGEEMWVAMHLYHRGLESEIWPQAKCVHHQSEGGQREKVFYFFTRNSFLLYYQRFPFLLTIPMVPYKMLRTLINVRSGKELVSWFLGIGSGLTMIVRGQAKRDTVSWSGAVRYLRAVRMKRDS